MDLNAASQDLDRRLRAAGLDPDRLEPWPAWKVFKAYAREVTSADADVMYVQLGLRDPTDELLHVTFVRHFELVDDEGELHPVREVVCDLGYDPATDLAGGELELCSGDFPTLEAFIATVEGEPCFQAAMAREPVGSLVSFSEL
jgi:hypothetical protein